MKTLGPESRGDLPRLSETFYDFTGMAALWPGRRLEAGVVRQRKFVLV